MSIHFSTVVQAITIGINYQWISAIGLHFSTVVQAITIGICNSGGGVVDINLIDIRQAITICINGSGILLDHRRFLTCNRRSDGRRDRTLSHRGSGHHRGRLNRPGLRGGADIGELQTNSQAIEAVLLLPGEEIAIIVATNSIVQVVGIGKIIAQSHFHQHPGFKIGLKTNSKRIHGCGIQSAAGEIYRGTIACIDEGGKLLGAVGAEIEPKIAGNGVISIFLRSMQSVVTKSKAGHKYGEDVKL